MDRSGVNLLHMIKAGIHIFQLKSDIEYKIHFPFHILNQTETHADEMNRVYDFVSLNTDGFFFFLFISSTRILPFICLIVFTGETFSHK